MKTRHFIKEKAATELLKTLEARLKVRLADAFKEKKGIEVVSDLPNEVYLIDGKPVAAKSGGIVIPVLTYVDELQNLPRIVVDMGAVPRICSGADVMVPGISKVEGEFIKGDIVIIVDEKNRRPLAVGVSLVDSKLLKKLEKGKVIENHHYVGDKLWGLLKELSS